MKVFFGAAIQGHQERGNQSVCYQSIFEAIRAQDFEILTEHTTGRNYDEVVEKLEKALGPLPPLGPERTTFVRNKMIEFVESDLDALIFELSVPSLGTGVEFAHAYLWPRMGLKPVPMLGLYRKGFWPNNLSTMIRGLNAETVPQFTLYEYEGDADLVDRVRTFLAAIGS